MNLLEKYAEAFDQCDIEKMKEVWCEDGIFDDIAVKLLTGMPGYFKGKENIIQMFSDLFSNDIQVRILKMYPGGKKMDYDVIVNGSPLPCFGTLIDEEDGRMKYYLCQPRED